MVSSRPWHIVEGLTGRRRHRIQRRLFRESLMVLQLEQTVGVYRELPTPRTPRSEAINRYTSWRDATPDDLMPDAA